MLNSHYCQQCGLPHATLKILKSAQNCHYFLQLAVMPDYMGSTFDTDRTYHVVFFSRAEKPSEDITSCLFLMSIKGLMLTVISTD
jgi:hypothetical protein